MIKKPKIVIITGAESTGKSKLTQLLAERFNVPYIPEYARTYIENLGRKYKFSDVEIIARKQVEQLKAFKNSDYPIIFVDTWLIITKVWFKIVYNSVPDWIEHELLNTPVDLFLLCDIDLPWRPDPVRENGGNMRLVLHNMYIAEIKKYKFRYQTVSGSDDKRFLNAIKLLNQTGII